MYKKKYSIKYKKFQGDSVKNERAIEQKRA